MVRHLSSIHVRECASVVLLSSYLDELLEQLYSLAERRTHEHLRHDPLLDLITALEEDRERHCMTCNRSTAEGVVHQLLLHAERWKCVSDTYYLPLTLEPKVIA